MADDGRENVFYWYDFIKYAAAQRFLLCFATGGVRRGRAPDKNQ